MNKLKIFVLFLLLPCFASAATKVNEVTSRGVKAWVITDNSLPIVAVKLSFKNAGFAYDPAAKQGLAYFVASTLNEGAGEWDSQAFQKALDENAIQMQFAADADNFYITLKTISSNLDLALKMLSAALTNPHFNGDDVQRVRAQIATMISKSDEEAGFLAGKKFNEIMFKNHPYSNLEMGSLTSVAAITPDDLINYIATKFARQNLVVGIVGDVDANLAETIVREIAGNLPLKPSFAAIKAVESFPSNIVQNVHINNPQTTIIFGSKGIKRSDPNFFAAYMLDHILGGDGFESRLVNIVREKNGMAYYIGTSLHNADYADLWLGSVGTKANQTAQVIDLIKKEYKKMADKGVTQKELDAAKSYITGSFALNVDKIEKLASYLVMMQLEDLWLEYLEKRNSYVDAVTLEQVNTLAKALISAESLVFVTAGK